MASFGQSHSYWSSSNGHWTSISSVSIQYTSAFQRLPTVGRSGKTAPFFGL